MKRKILIGVLIILVLIQFIRPKRNLGSALGQNDITHVIAVPDSIMNVLKRSCFDCHSNHTIYPWYAEVNPVGLWLNHHIDEGKRELNFSEFATYPARKMDKKLDETAKQVKEHEMPLNSYTWMHKDAILTEQEIQLMADWSDSSRKQLASSDR